MITFDQKRDGYTDLSRVYGYTTPSDSSPYKALCPIFNHLVPLCLPFWNKIQQRVVMQKVISTPLIVENESCHHIVEGNRLFSSVVCPNRFSNNFSLSDFDVLQFGERLLHIYLHVTEHNSANELIDILHNRPKTLSLCSQNTHICNEWS